MSLMPIPPGMKIAAQVSPDADDDELQFVRQMGIDWAVGPTDGQHAGYDYYARTKDRFDKAGIRIYGFGNRDVHNQEAIVLALDNRDAKIEEYLNHLTALGKAGIPHTTYAHMANGIWSTDRELTRGGAAARGFDLAKSRCRALGRPTLLSALHAWPCLLPRRDLGELLLLRRAGCAGRRSSRCPYRDPP